jgi:hypothetical protein
VVVALALVRFFSPVSKRLANLQRLKAILEATKPRSALNAI